MTDLDVQNEVRKRMGFDPMPNPHVIQGFGPDDPPPPPLGTAHGSTGWPSGMSMPSTHVDEYDLEEDEPVPAGAVPVQAGTPQASPLLALAQSPVRAPSTPELVVIGKQAHYASREAALSQTAYDRIAAIVLREIKRQVESELKQHESRLPKRKYQRSGVTKPAVAPAPEASETPKPRRRRRKEGQ